MKIIKNCAAFLLLTVCVLTFSCEKKDNLYGVPANDGLFYEIALPENEYELSECITDVLRAEYTGNFEVKEQNVFLEFKVLEAIVGKTGSETVHILCRNLPDPTGDPALIVYKTGGEYLLVTARYCSVYYDYDWYVPINESAFTARADSEKNYESLCEYYRAQASGGSFKNDCFGTDYVRSNDIGEIVRQSPFVIKIKVKELKRSHPVCGEYECEVLEVYKGQTGEKTVGVFLKEDSVEIGKEYIILVSDKITAPEYGITSKNSVYPSDDTENVEKILAELEAQTESDA